MNTNTRTMTVAVVGVVLVVAGAVALVPTPAPAEPSVQTSSFDVEGDSIAVNDTISLFTLSGGGTVEWANVPGGAEEVTVKLRIEEPDSVEGNPKDAIVATRTHDVSGESGSIETRLSGDVLEQTGWTADDFTPPEGGNVTETLHVTFQVAVSWDNSSVGTGASDEVTVTVTDATDDDGGGDVSDVTVTITATGVVELSE